MSRYQYVNGERLECAGGFFRCLDECGLSASHAGGAAKLRMAWWFAIWVGGGLRIPASAGIPRSLRSRPLRAPVHPWVRAFAGMTVVVTNGGTIPRRAEWAGHRPARTWRSPSLCEKEGPLSARSPSP